MNNICQFIMWCYAKPVFECILQYFYIYNFLSKVVFISKGLGLLNVCAFLTHNILENISTDIFLSACIPSSSILFYNFICGKG